MQALSIRPICDMYHLPKALCGVASQFQEDFIWSDLPRYWGRASNVLFSDVTPDAQSISDAQSRVALALGKLTPYEQAEIKSVVVSRKKATSGKSKRAPILEIALSKMMPIYIPAYE